MLGMVVSDCCQVFVESIDDKLICSGCGEVCTGHITVVVEGDDI